MVTKKQQFWFSIIIWMKEKLCNEPLRGLFVVVLFIFFLWLVINRAWISDDAYITLRTIDNFISGRGLVWNVGERVQSYTHPLWMFLLSSIYFFTHEAYFTTLVLSITVSLMTVIFLVFLCARSKLSGIVGVFMLSMSGAFLDYSTSGLENPLTHLLLVLFAFVYLQRNHSQFQIFWLALITSLLVINRIDTVLLTFPALAYFFWKNRSRHNFYLVFLGLLPVIAWESFSILYYGFPFPNTAYAKLNTTITATELARQGLMYYKFTLMNDPWSLIVITLGLSSIILSTKRLHHFYLAFGIFLYLLYIIKIGGDFMGGRFFTPPLILAVILMISNYKIADERRIITSVILLGLIIGTLAVIPPWKSQHPNYDFSEQVKQYSGVIDERSAYYFATGLLSGTSWQEFPDHPWRYQGEEARLSVVDVVVFNSVGFFGYYAGPGVYIVDQYALCDPFLARLPFSPKGKWRIGHFSREIPTGYLESLSSGKTHFENDQLGIYYSELSHITRGKVLDVERLATIAKMNLGLFDYLLR